MNGIPAEEAAGDADEYELKSAFLFKFARYASWPKGTFKKKNSPIIIAVIGKDEFGPKLESLVKGKKIGDRPVVIHRYAKAADIKDVHLAILGKLSEKETEAAVEALNKRGALVVADEGGTEATGASIGFRVEGKKIRFEVHARHLKASKIRLGSQLLKLAKIVGRDKKQ